MNGINGKTMSTCHGKDVKAADDTVSVADDNVCIELGDQASDDVTDNALEKPDDESNVPKDKGWAWFVLLGTLLEMTLVVGVLKSAGLIFVAFQEKFSSTSSMTSLLSTLQNATYSLSAPFVLSVGKRLTSSRNLLAIGSLIVFTAYVITSQAQDVRILLFSHGILQGFGTSFMQPVAIVTLASYFEKRRGFANSMAVSGGSLGGLILAPLLSFLLKQYGYQGCFLILASIFLHGLIVAALLRPHSFYTKRHRKHKDAKPNACEEKIIPTVGNGTANGIDTRHHASDNITVKGKGDLLQETESKVPLIQEHYGHKQPEQSDTLIHQNGARKRTATVSSCKSQISNIFDSLNNVQGSTEYMCGSMLDITVNSTKGNNRTKIDENDKIQPRTSIKSLLKTLVSSFDFKLFKNPIFCVLQLASFLICANSALCIVFIAPHARDMGIPVDKIALIITILSVSDFVSRVTIAVLADRGWIRRSNITACTVLIVGISSNCLRFYKSFELLMFYGIILGMFAGTYFSLFSVLIVDYLTIHKLQAAFGFTSLFHGAGVSLFFYIIGYLRDVTGSYIISFHLMGCLNLFGSILHLSLPFVERWYNRRNL